MVNPRYSIRDKNLYRLSVANTEHNVKKSRFFQDQIYEILVPQVEATHKIMTINERTELRMPIWKLRKRHCIEFTKLSL